MTLPMLNYQEVGQGKPLVLLHGLGESIRFWEYQAPVFAQHYRVILIDLPGFGQSQRLPHYSVAGMAQAVWTLLESLGISSLYLLGHSMGGAVAQQLTLDHPQAVTKLVLANTVPTFRPVTLWQRFEVVYRLIVMRLLGSKRLSKIGAQRMFPGEHQTELRLKSEARGSATNGAHYIAALRALTQWSVLDRLREFTMPVLVLAAEHDYFSREDMLQFAHALPRGRFHLFEGTYHAMAMEVPDLFNHTVLRFLESR